MRETTNATNEAEIFIEARRLKSIIYLVTDFLTTPRMLICFGVAYVCM